MNLKFYINEAYEKEYKQALLDKVLALESIYNFEEKYKDSLGWLDVKEHANKAILDNIIKIAEEIQKNADVFILIGVGGSNNTARAIIEAFKDSIDKKVPEIIYAGNNLSAYELNKILKRIENKSVYIQCIAKNFETLEPGMAFRIFRKYLYDRYKEEASKRIITTGTKASLLEKISLENGYRFLDFPTNIGGRYSFATNVSFLALAVAGLDIYKFVQGISDMKEKLFADKGATNIAYKYALMRNLLYKKGYKIELLASFEPRLEYFYKWWIQLFAESEGKDKKGLFVSSALYSEELHSLGQFIQEGENILFETFINIKDEGFSYKVPISDIDDKFAYLDNLDLNEINKRAYQATLKAHSTSLPCIELEIDKLDIYELGSLMYFFAFACYISCNLLAVNPFNQNGVEEYKNNMFKLLKR